MQSSIQQVFGEVIRKHRLAIGLSQEDFADKAGVHRTYMSSIELGKVQVSIGIADKLATTLGIPLSKIWREMEKRRSDEDNAN